MSDRPAGGIGEAQSASAGAFPVPCQKQELGVAFFGLGRLGGRGVVLAAQAYRQLDHASRQRFDKHTPPISYHYRAERAG